jgi:hypothetical protein
MVLSRLLTETISVAYYDTELIMVVKRWLTVTNALAYYDWDWIWVLKRFVVPVPEEKSEIKVQSHHRLHSGTNLIKLFCQAPPRHDPEKVRLGRKCLPGSITRAQRAKEWITVVKVFENWPMLQKRNFESEMMQNTPTCNCRNFGNVHLSQVRLKIVTFT